MSIAHISTVAFEAIDAREVDVQVHIAESGQGQFTIVGLADKLVGVSRERVSAALSAVGLGMPCQRITVNLAPADLPKKEAITICRSRSPLLGAMTISFTNPCLIGIGTSISRGVS